MQRITLLLCFCFSSFFSFSQTQISGLVKELKGEAIIGANIFIKDSYDGSSSDLEGRFSFSTEETGKQVLQISYLGFETYEEEVELNGTPLTFNLDLKPITNSLDAVVITAGAFEASDERKAVVLNPIDIVTTAGATADIAGALNTLPGTQAVGEEGKLFVRGGAAYETRTFIDGLYVQSPYSSTVPDIPARGRFSPFLFKGTTFSTGGYSAEYGQALSSALILNSQDLPEQTVTGISLMTVGAGFSHTQRWNKTSLSVSADYTNLSPYTALVPQNINWEKPFRGGSGQIVFRQKTSETGLFKLYATATRNNFSMNYPSQTAVDQTNLLSLTNENIYLNTSYKEIFGEKWSLFLGASYSKNTDKIQELFNLYRMDEASQGKITSSYHLSEKVKLKFGGEWIYTQFDERYVDPFGEIFPSNFNNNYLGNFAEADIQFSKNFVARLGARFEHTTLLNKSNIAPRLSLAYKTGKHSQVSFAYGQFFQSPENEFLRFNHQLDFEQASHLILNYQIIKKGRTLRVELYDKRYDDLVKFEAQQPWISNNDGKGYARGLDIFFRDRKSIKNGDYWVSYSLLDTKRDYRDFPQLSAPFFASKHNLSLVYKHWIPKITSSIGFTYTHASPRTYNDPNLPVFNSEKTKSYNDLSFNISYLTNLFNQFTIIYAAVNNVPGFNQSFGYRFSDTPDAEGKFTSIAVRPPAKRFFFVGIFVSIGQNYQVQTNTGS